MSGSDSDTLSLFEESTRNARDIQRQTLRSILETNAGVSYLRRHLPPDASDPDSFLSRVPISSYEDDYARLVQDMADGGDSSALSVDPLLCFFRSSGTSSMKPKLVPYFDSSLGRTASQIAHRTGSAMLRRFVPHRTNPTKILWFLHGGNVTETTGGFRAMAASSFPMQTNDRSLQMFLNLCTSPSSVVLGSDAYQQTYCHLLCGLRQFDLVDGIRAAYASGLVTAFRVLESKFEQLCEDIEFGSVNACITDVNMRNAVQELLGGSRPDIANRIRGICKDEDWDGILSVLWPELRYVACVATGSMKQYYPLLKRFAGERILVLGGDYFASECAVGINVDRPLPPEKTSYVILPNAAYFEFIPFELGANFDVKQDTVVDIAGVEIGRSYEVVVTTFRGLYRYRLGDVVRVVGFHNLSPKVEFIGRAPNNNNDAFTERDLMSAMVTSELMFKQEIVEYTGCLDSGTDSKHVIIFVELKRMSETKQEELVSVLKRWCVVVEDCLGGVYQAKREYGDVGPLEMCIVKQGCFDELMKVAIANGAPPSQYKPPKILRNQDMVSVLKASVVVTTM